MTAYSNTLQTLKALAIGGFFTLLTACSGGGNGGEGSTTTNPETVTPKFFIEPASGGGIGKGVLLDNTGRLNIIDLETNTVENTHFLSFDNVIGLYDLGRAYISESYVSHQVYLATFRDGSYKVFNLRGDNIPYIASQATLNPIKQVVCRGWSSGDTFLCLLIHTDGSITLVTSVYDGAYEYLSELSSGLVNVEKMQKFKSNTFVVTLKDGESTLFSMSGEVPSELALEYQNLLDSGTLFQKVLPLNRLSYIAPGDENVEIFATLTNQKKISVFTKVPFEIPAVYKALENLENVKDIDIFDSNSVDLQLWIPAFIAIHNDGTVSLVPMTENPVDASNIQPETYAKIENLKQVESIQNLTYLSINGELEKYELYAIKRFNGFVELFSFSQSAVVQEHVAVLNRKLGSIISASLVRSELGGRAVIWVVKENGSIVFLSSETAEILLTL